MQKIILWIDISKDSLDIFNWNTEKSFKIKNDYTIIMKFFKKEFPNNLGNILVIFEPTWVYWYHLIKTLNDLEINYFQIWLDVTKKLWDILHSKNKTDKIDAKKIYIIGKMIHNNETNKDFKSKIIKWVSNETLLSINILSNINSLKDTIKKNKQYIHNLENSPFLEIKILKQTKKVFEKTNKDCQKQIDILEQKLQEIIDSSWYKENREKLETIPWIWIENSLLLSLFFIQLIEKWLWRKDIKKVKSYSWLAPKIMQSGTSVNRTWLNKAWKTDIRKWLYMSAINWMQFIGRDKHCETNLYKFSTRMRDKFRWEWNKRWKSIACAIASKIVSISWCIFLDNKEYNFS